MLTFVSFLWQQPGYHTQYTDEHVRRWATMIQKHYSAPHRLVVITDLPGDYGPCEVVGSPEAPELPNPHGASFPSCYRRLWLWSDEARSLGERVVLMDLDCSVLGDLSPLLNRTEDVVLWRDPSYPVQPYNGGMIMMRTGCRPDVYSAFKGQASINAARARGYKGSDQAWIAYCLGREQAVWTTRDGVHSWKRDLRRGMPESGTLIAMFHGIDKPWHAQEVYH